MNNTNNAVDDYMNELAMGLNQLSEKDRQDVLEFYREYIMDANLDTTEKITHELGTPHQLTRKILADYSLNDQPTTADTKPKTENGKSKDNMRAIWWILLGMLALPIGIPAFFFLLLFLFLALMFIILFVVGFITLVIGLAVGGIFLLVKATPLIFTSWAVGLFYTGTGILLISLDMMIVPLAFAAVRLIIQGITNFSRWVGRKVFKRKYYQQTQKEADK